MSAEQNRQNFPYSGGFYGPSQSEMPPTPPPARAASRGAPGTGSKRALLVGCNYPGSKCPLSGCVNDVMSIKKLLVEHKGFRIEDIRIMIDTDSRFEQPTGKNIRTRLTELVAASKPGDVLVFHFSGHGTQIPCENGSEEDGKDEAICPTDMNLIVDDDLHDIISPLPESVIFTFIADCCHSGGMLEHSQIEISGPKKGGVSVGGGGPSLSDLVGGISLGGHGRDIDAREIGPANIRNRSLPTNYLAQMLGDKLGGVNVPENAICTALQGVFGDDSSHMVGNRLEKLFGPKYKDVAALLSKKEESSHGSSGDRGLNLGSLLSGGGGGGSGGHSSMASSLASSLLSGGSSGGSHGHSGGHGGLAGSLASSLLSGGSHGQSASSSSGGHGSMAAALGGALLAAVQNGGKLDVNTIFQQFAGGKSQGKPQKKPSTPLHPDKGILITGCQSHETSADACPSGDKDKAFGALTNALTSILAANPNATYYDLVTGVRHKLGKEGFAQNPCLECSSTNAQKPFIC